MMTPNARRPSRTGRLALLIVASAALAVAVLFVWGVLNARAVPLVRRATIGLADWPEPASQKLRVALVSDIHIGNITMDQARLQSIVDEVNNLKPDVVLLAGDFVVGHNRPGAAKRAAELVAPLSMLHPPLGTIAVLGNHDYWTDPRAITSALSQAGVTILDNQALSVGPIVIAGVGDRFSGHDQAASTLRAARGRAGPIVLLTHSPDLSPDLPSSVQLVLAGHTHCGQVVLPWGAPLATRSPLAGGKPLYNQRYRCGVIADPGRLVIVTAGVGSGTAPIRFGAPPDIWLLTLGAVPPGRPAPSWARSHL